MVRTTILLVDNEDAFLKAMERRLAKRSVPVVSAHSGPDALDLLRKDPSIDVVILDVAMPGMEGIETLREIKRSSPAAEVLLLTGHGMLESAIEGMRLGAFDCMSKPCDLEELLAKVREVRNRKRRQQQRILEVAGRDLARNEDAL